MEELLQKLLEREVLSDDIKTELEDAFKTQLDEAITAAKEEAAADVRAELTEQWVKERDTLIEAIDSKVGEYLETELEELKEDIDRFRDLEAEYAEKLVEAKAAMGDELKSDLKDLVEKIDAFLEIRLAAEMEELREDIEDVRKNTLGRKIIEAFADEFASLQSDEDTGVTLRETQERLSDTEKALADSEQKRAELERSVKMEEVLSPLTGRQRDIMEAILRKVDTDNLEEGYKTFIGRVVRESVEETDDATSEKEDKVLAESEEKDSDELTEGVAVSGDGETVVNEGADPDKAASIAHWQRLAGIR